MFKILNVVFVILFSFSFLYSQDDKMKDFQFQTEDVQTESTSYFAIGVGYTATFHLLNMDDMNTLANQFGVGNLKSTVYLNGIEISTGTVLIKNVNIGFFNQYGNISSSGIVNSLNRNIDYAFQNTGFLIDYGIVPFKSFAILPGVQVGFAKSTINVSQTDKDINWNEIQPNQLANNYYYKLEKSFLDIEPKVSIQYAVTNFIALRLNASYSISMSNPFANSDWIFNDNVKVNNVPSQVNQSGVKFQLGVFVGLMNF
jgi:hypothetical protein